MKERSLITSINMHDLIVKDIPPKEMILAPIIPKQGLVMLFAARGIGTDCRPRRSARGQWNLWRNWRSTTP